MSDKNNCPECIRKIEKRNKKAAAKIALGRKPSGVYYLSMNSIIAVGFGTAVCTRDGEVIYDESLFERDNPGQDLPLVQFFEDMAEKSPNHKWIIHMDAPLWEEVYARQADGQWLMTEQGMGFA